MDSNTPGHGEPDPVFVEKLRRLRDDQRARENAAADPAVVAAHARDVLNSVERPTADQYNYAGEYVPREALERVYDTIALLAAELNGSEKSAVERALYAAKLSVDADLVPGDAVDVSFKWAETDAYRKISDSCTARVAEADGFADALEYGEGDGGRFYCREFRADLTTEKLRIPYAPPF